MINATLARSMGRPRHRRLLSRRQRLTEPRGFDRVCQFRHSEARRARRHARGSAPLRPAVGLLRPAPRGARQSRTIAGVGRELRSGRRALLGEDGTRSRRSAPNAARKVAAVNGVDGCCCSAILIAMLEDLAGPLGGVIDDPLVQPAAPVVGLSLTTSPSDSLCELRQRAARLRPATSRCAVSILASRWSPVNSASVHRGRARARRG